MRTGLIAKKIGMSSMFTEKGERIPLTFLKIDNCQVVDHRTVEKNGYNALVIGSQNVKKIAKVSKSMKQVFASKKIEPKVNLKEFRITDDCFIDIGTTLYADHFIENQFVDITSISKGCGFAGVMKRHNFRGLEASHGVSISHRSHGSTGGRQDPGRVFKGKKMAGHMGDTQVTVQNLKVVSINKDSDIILVKGNIPGSNESLLYIKDAIKKTVIVLKAV